MKRCPQCDFVYENDQRLCDFDGTELAAYETAALPPPEIVAPPPQAVAPAVAPVRSRRVGFILLPVVAVMSAAVLYFAYHSIPRRPAPPQDSSPSPVNVTTPPQPAPSPALAPPHAADAPSPAPHPATPEEKKVRRAHPAVKPPLADARTPLPAQAEKPVAASPKKDSKLGSIMKKTGRLLKKPFKF
jgi:hypothetical protein